MKLLAALALLVATPAFADNMVDNALTGFDWIVSPGVYLPQGVVGGDPGFALSDHIGYGLKAGPLYISPGVSVPFFAIPGALALNILGEVQVSYPIGSLAPYALFGLGVGIRTGDFGTTGLGMKVGGGAMFFFTQSFGLGVEVAYDKIDAVDLVHIVAPIHLWF